jgi:hypothetical protein
MMHVPVRSSANSKQTAQLTCAKLQSFAHAAVLCPRYSTAARLEKDVRRGLKILRHLSRTSRVVRRGRHTGSHAAAAAYVPVRAVVVEEGPSEKVG